MTDIKIQPLDIKFLMPNKASEGSAAYDALLPATTKLRYGRQVIPLGFAIEMPSELSLDSRARSGYTLKGLLVYDKHGYEYRIDADVQLGLIDSDYRGEVGAIVIVRDLRVLFKTFYVKRGQAIGQLKFNYVPKTHFILSETLSDTERGTNGYGQQNNE